MKLREMVASLIDAELAYAHFNALRTAAVAEHSPFADRLGRSQSGL